MNSPATPLHEETFGFLHFLLLGFVRQRKLGKVLGSQCPMELGNNVFSPDLMFISRESRAIVTPKKVIGPADFVIEILSPSTFRHDLGRKLQDYSQHGIPEIWFVDPERRRLHTVRRSESYAMLERREGRIETAAVPGFWIDVAWLWKDPLPDPLSCLRKLLAR